MRTVFFLAIAFASQFSSVFYPRKPFKLEKNEISIWRPEYKSETSEKYNGKTLLIFEGNFDDSLQILFKNKEAFRARILTNKSINRVVPVFEINTKNYSNKDSICISLLNKKVSTVFLLLHKFKYVYIQRLIKKEEFVWYLQFSNYSRDYY